MIVAGSCNFTTSSKANQEVSYALEVVSGLMRSSRASREVSRSMR